MSDNDAKVSERKKAYMDTIIKHYSSQRDYSNYYKIPERLSTEGYALQVDKTVAKIAKSMGVFG